MHILCYAWWFDKGFTFKILPIKSVKFGIWTRKSHWGENVSKCPFERILNLSETWEKFDRFCLFLNYTDTGNIWRKSVLEQTWKNHVLLLCQIKVFFNIHRFYVKYLCENMKKKCTSHPIYRIVPKILWNFDIWPLDSVIKIKCVFAKEKTGIM